MDTENEKILNLPSAIGGLIAAFVIVHIAVVYGPESLAEWIYARFAFVPARFAFLFDPDGVLARLATQENLSADETSRVRQALTSGVGVYLSPVAYGFLHGDWTHLSVNALSLAAFGSPVAKRLGAAAPFLLFMAFGAFAGAMTHFAFQPEDFNPVVGASAAVSGTMGAIARFAFVRGATLAHAGDAPLDAPELAPLSELASHPRARTFVVLWLAVNFLLGVFPQLIGISGAIAWQAHVGGFVFGLLFFGFFDRAARRIVGRSALVGAGDGREK